MLRNLLVVLLFSTLVPSVLGAQASARMKVSATVVARQAVAPQVSAAELTESVTEQLLAGEHFEMDRPNVAELEESGVLVTTGVVRDADVHAPEMEGLANGQQVLHVTVAYSGN